MMVPGYEQGFGYLENVAIDQHVTQRGRQAHLGEVVTRYPHLLGLGIDEDTAAVVDGDMFRVIGTGRVLVTDGVEHDGLPYLVLGRGARFNLADWSVRP